MTQDNSDELINAQIRGFSRRLDQLEDSFRTHVEGLKELEANLDQLESQIDNKLETFKASLLFNELNEFQEQIDRLNDRIANLETENLTMRRRIFRDRLISLESQVGIHIHEYNHAPPFPHNIVGTQRVCFAEVQTAIAEVRGRLDNSVTPETEMERITTSINESLQAHGYDPIRWI